jgi:GT2 family glycosyltransferase
LPVGGVPVARALSTGLFELSFYEAQAGITFLSLRHACHHYLTKGAALGLLPHPIVDAELAFDEERALGLARAMARGSVRSHRYSTRFDWASYIAAEPSAASHPGGVAGYFALSHPLSAGTPLLTRQGEPADWSGSSRRQIKRRRRWASVIAESGLFDSRYYGAQVGVDFLSTRSAVWHYLSVGEASGLGPSPLFEPEWYNQRRSARRGSALADYLSSHRNELSPHPQFDPVRYIEEVPAAAKHPAGALRHFLENATDSTTTFPFDGYTPKRNWFLLRGQLFGGARAFAEGETARRWGEPHPWSRSTARTHARRMRRLTAMVTDAPPLVAIIVDLGRSEDDTSPDLAPLLAQRYPNLEIVVAAEPGDVRASALPEGVRVVEAESSNSAKRINRAVAATRADFVHVWDPAVVLDPAFILDSLVGLRAAGTEFVYSSVTSGAALESLAWGAPFSRDGLVWGDSTAIASTTVVSRRLFRAVDGFEPTLSEAHAWDFALRASVEVTPVYLPVLRATRPATETVPAPIDEHIARARALCDWSAAASVERVPGRVSLLIPVFEDWRLTVDGVRAALDTTVGRDVEVVLVDNGSRRAVGNLILAALGYQPRVVYSRVPVNTNFSTGSNLALLASTGATSIFVNNDTEPTSGWLDPLLAALDEDGVRGAQPLLLYPDGTVQAAGTVLMGAALPWHFLIGHPREDAIRADERVFSALTAAFLAVRASEAIAVEGFDPAYANGMEDVDLCLRLTERFGGDFRVALESVVIHKESQSPGRFEKTGPNRALFMRRWASRMPNQDLHKYESAGLRVDAYRSLAAHRSHLFRSGEIVLSRPARLVDAGPAQGLPSLRWAIKTAAHPDARGDSWGDTFFADDLARALRGLGQEVVIDRRRSHVRPHSDYLDDVILGLRGLDQITPQPGATSLLWIISHPELVDTAELQSGFDLVYAASSTWADYASTWSSREVRPLLQATDPARFHPGDTDAALASDTLFVGRTRKVFRPIIRDAIAARADLTVFGDGWDEYIDPGYVRAEFLENERLPDAYRSARIVLNDHWSDMAELGFLSNRLFDAAATGARVITDRVAGLGDLFGPLVREYDDVDDLRGLLDDDGWPSAEERRSIAARVAREHSFDARARTLLADVLDARGVPHELR